jgi:uncharacterized membrane protein
MERMVVVVFDDEARAYEAADVLQSFNEDRTVAVHESWVLTKDADGSVNIVKTEDSRRPGPSRPRFHRGLRGTVSAFLNRGGKQ